MEAAANGGKNDALGLAVTITATGNRISMPSRVKVPMPANPEEIRERIGLLAAGIDFFKLKQPEVKAFQKVNDTTWTAHLNYILGPKVRGKEVHDNDGHVVKKPSWPLVLNYEQAIRAQAALLMNEGNSENGFQPLPMEEALKLAREDKELRSEIFLERLHLQSGNGERKGPGRKGAASSSHGGDGGKKGDGKKGKPVRKPTTKDRAERKVQAKAIKRMRSAEMVRAAQGHTCASTVKENIPCPSVLQPD